VLEPGGHGGYDDCPDTDHIDAGLDHHPGHPNDGTGHDYRSHPHDGSDHHHGGNDDDRSHHDDHVAAIPARA
jgi:hypothetical protein